VLQLVSAPRSLASFAIITPFICCWQLVSAPHQLVFVCCPGLSLRLRSVESECPSLTGFLLPFLSFPSLHALQSVRAPFLLAFFRCPEFLPSLCSTGRECPSVTRQAFFAALTSLSLFASQFVSPPGSLHLSVCPYLTRCFCLSGCKCPWRAGFLLLS
jgi:hypothetical protein